MNGLRSCIIQAEDIMLVADWYTRATKTEPYFQNENYIGFNLGGFELGIFKRDEDYITSGNNIEVYWGVDDVSTDLTRLIELGAKPHNSLANVGGGIEMGSVIDPFGNIFGLIHNPNFSV